ncbi:hypothetical protein TSUD_210090 [Trifolium subterraneum]|uniref:Uncharacterized protein n=1 Tax=Trifolium subterraneum TaxID=3900 RepID=A0A2Z6NW64_TRISU|nr:hypothetical protein TSUD_210090 [Trifolium subterraneum]
MAVVVRRVVMPSAPLLLPDLRTVSVCSWRFGRESIYGHGGVFIVVVFSDDLRSLFVGRWCSNALPPWVASRSTRINHAAVRTIVVVSDLFSKLTIGG